MATIKLDGFPVHTTGDLPVVGAVAPAFCLVDTTLTERTLGEFIDQPLVLNIFSSLETPVCAASVRRFNELAAREGMTVLCISADLPFAHQRFCAAAGIDRVVSLSTFRSPAFGRDYGVLLTDGAFAGLLARAVLVIDRTGRVTYGELVPEIGQEPDYAAAMRALPAATPSAAGAL